MAVNPNILMRIIQCYQVTFWTLPTFHIDAAVGEVIGGFQTSRAAPATKAMNAESRETLANMVVNVRFAG